MMYDELHSGQKYGGSRVYAHTNSSAPPDFLYAGMVSRQARQCLYTHTNSSAPPGFLRPVNVYAHTNSSASPGFLYARMVFRQARQCLCPYKQQRPTRLEAERSAFVFLCHTGKHLFRLPGGYQRDKKGGY